MKNPMPKNHEIKLGYVLTNVRVLLALHFGHCAIMVGWRPSSKKKSALELFCIVDGALVTGDDKGTACTVGKVLE